MGWDGNAGEGVCCEFTADRLKEDFCEEGVSRLMNSPTREENGYTEDTSFRGIFLLGDGAIHSRRRRILGTRGRSSSTGGGSVLSASVLNNRFGGRE